MDRKGKNWLRGIMAGIFCAGVLTGGVGVGVAFADFSRFTYVPVRAEEEAFQTETFTYAIGPEDGERIWGMKETSEIIMHSMAYDICEENGWDVGGVVHSHSKVLTAFSMACRDIETEALPEMMGNFHKIPCAPYGAPGTKYILTMAEPYLAEGYRIVLLGNHGSLAVGKTVEDAMNIVEASEAIAEQILSTNYILGGEKKLDALEVARFYEIYKENRAKRVK